MCIIAAKRRGIALPLNFETIFNSCWTSNPGGGGYMLKRHGDKVIHLKKGFMSRLEFLDAIKELEVAANDEFVAHFRIATHGSRSADMTHPFVIDSNPKIVGAMECVTGKSVMCHNGMIRGVRSHETYSDSFIFAMDILGSYDPTWTSNNRKYKKWKKRFRALTCGQKLAIMHPNNDLELLGQFYYATGLGMFFSNTGYKSYSYFNNGNDRRHHRSDEEICCSR
jgi:hypothetical protein